MNGFGLGSKNKIYLYIDEGSTSSLAAVVAMQVVVLVAITIAWLVGWLVGSLIVREPVVNCVVVQLRLCCSFYSSMSKIMSSRLFAMAMASAAIEFKSRLSMVG